MTNNGIDEKQAVTFSHRPVLLDECIQALNIRPDGIYVDGTAGGGGHSFAIASKLQGGRLVAIDQDESAIAAAGQRLAVFGDTVQLYRSNFRAIADVCARAQVEAIDGVLLDLGVSSYQLDTPERGFSYNNDAPLDMRMDKRNLMTAQRVVNEYSEYDLKRILFEYGEEKFSGRIAAGIVAARQISPIQTTGELVRVIKAAIPAAAREGGHHPAKRTFQAIRIEVNAELDVIAPAIESAVGLLRSGGRMAIITFHSLEDRIVKQTFAKLAQGCTCPKSLPICVCGNRPRVTIETKKPILPGKEELEQNPRARSAKLRVITKL